ncbi:MAG: serine/threonine-protein phosphatase [Planctomycetota bacterium]|nr:MAG: serine/threonine-protein phosphatase [Planctomycetota bacterium]
MLSQRSIEKKVAEGLASDERWKVILGRNKWLCPYCMRIGARGLRMDEPIEEKIALHFARDCPAWNYFEVEPQPMDKLRQMARYLVFVGRTVRRIQEDRRFRFLDDEGGWICPYCLETERVRAASFALDDPAAWGAAPEEQPFAQDVARHLLGCEPFARDEEGLHDLPALEERRARGLRSNRLRRLKERFQQERSFQLVDQERRWLCPFCGKAQDVRLPRRGPDDAFYQRLDAHLALCKAYRVLAGRPRPVEELKAKVLASARARQLSKIRHKVTRHSLWRVRDLDGRWYCPYCCEATLVRYPERRDDGSKDPEREEQFYAAVLEHLGACDDYRRPKARVASRAAMAKVIQAANVQIDRRRRVRRLLTRDPIYGVTDSFASWLCPHCRKVQKQIALSADPESAVFEKTVEQVVAHLFEECEEFSADRPPRATRAELEQQVRQDALRASGVRERRVVSATDSLDEEKWQRIREDLEAVRSRVERVRQHESHLREARSKQLRLLPELPELEGYEFGRIYKPCEAVGGDFYHLFRASEGSLAVAIGDIAGHGIEAALLMGLAKKLLEVHGRGGTSPAQTLSLANRDIYSDLDERTFVTAFYGLLDIETRRFRFARAGHDPLILFNPERSPRLQVLDSKGMALGMDEGPLFEQMLEELEVALRPGDLLLQYTDGVTESMNADAEQFGAERLYAVVEEHGHHEVEYVLWKIEKAVQRFRGKCPRSDDFTMIGIKVL